MKGKGALIVSSSEGVKLTGRATNLVTLTERPDTLTNLVKILRKFGNAIVGFVKNNNTSSAYIQSLKLTGP